MPEWILHCERCGAESPATAALWCCSACRGPLAWKTERPFDRSQIAADNTGFWRFEKTLPVRRTESVAFGEAITPLTEFKLDGLAVLAKLDFLQPSGSYKDRGAAVLVSALKALGATHAVEDSSGNAAAAISAYAARAGLQCTVFAPAAASAGKLVQSQIYGATVKRIGGSRDDVARAAIDAAATISGATYASHNWHPFFIEGVKTWAFEVWEQLNFRAPDAVIAPAGSGSMILGASLAFGALLAAGEIARPPRLYAAQPAACAPIVAAFEAGVDDTTPFPRTATLAEGTSIANPVRGRELLSAIRASRGGAIAVSEPEIVDALMLAGRQGLFIEPTSAVAVAAARQLLTRGDINRDETTVIVLSGNGLKATETVQRLLMARE